MSAKTHGHKSNYKVTPTYHSWSNMKSRCTYPYIEKYRRRNIEVCNRWRDSFESFLADMGERPEGKTLDRIDNNKGYEPGNCRWATLKEQQRNTTRNKYLEYRGETRSLAEWSEVLGFSYSAVKQRINKLGWSVEKSFETPAMGKFGAPI